MSDQANVELVLDRYLNTEYDMVAKPGEYTGLCVIFNSCTFAAKCLPTRKGSDKDVDAIKKAFGGQFGFKVIELKDLEKTEMESCLKTVAKVFKPAWRCFVCFFLSHGLGEEDLVDFKGNIVNIKLLVKLFDGKNSPKTVGKPKLFFAQMCRGFDAVEYFRSQKAYDFAEDVLLPETAPANVSPDRDRLVCYATTPGCMAPMDPKEGSLFVQTLTKVLGLQSGKKIEEILQAVTHIVDIESSPEYKVCPVFDSTLVGKLVFRHRPKSEIEEVNLATALKSNAVLSELKIGNIEQLLMA